jgi:hypothetical protein
MRPGEAVIRLTALGYRFEVAEDKVRYRYEGPGHPKPQQAKPLLEAVRAHKEEVLFFLRCHCPRCGGMVFCPDLEGVSRCLACEWDYLATIYPGLNQRH